MSNYKYYIENVEVFPIDIGSQGVIFQKSVVSAVILEKQLSAAVTFRYNDTFDFKAQELEDPTKELKFTIKRKCNGVYTEFIRLFFTVAEGSFDEDKCLFEVTPRNEFSFRKNIPVNIIIEQNIINPTSLTPGVFYNGDYYRQTFYFDKTILSVAKKSNSKIVGIISDFFQINPENVSTEALPGVDNKWTTMAFASLSDIQNPIPSNKATAEFVTFQDLMDDLNILFDVFWFIDVNNNLRIEHRHYFEGIVGLDLTASKYSKYRSLNKYKYLLDKFPRVETLKVADSDQYAKFTNGYFATINNNSIEESRTTKVIRTDFAKIYYLGGSSSNDGLFLFACDATTPTNYKMYFELTDAPDYSSGQSIIRDQNVYLTPHYLYLHLHRYGRADYGSFFESKTVFSNTTYVDPYYYASGQIRAGGIKHLTIRPIIEQEETSVPICCDDDFDSDKKIKTRIGIGEIESAKLSMENNMLDVKLLYTQPKDTFTPLSLSGLDLWLRGDRGITYSGPSNYYVDQWNDYSGNGNHAVFDYDHKPYNGNNVYGVRFGNSMLTGGGHPNITVGTRTYLRVPGFQLFPNKRGTVFILYKNDFGLPSGPDANGTLLSTNDSASVGTSYFDISLTRSVLYSQNLTANTILPQHLYTNNRLYQFRRYEDDKVFCKDNSREIPLFQDGIALGFPYDIYNPATVDNVNYPIKDILIGDNPYISSGDCYQAILEVIVYNRALTDVEAERVENYLTKQGYYSFGTIVKEDP